jgi:hypothetical protein
MSLHASGFAFGGRKLNPARPASVSGEGRRGSSSNPGTERISQVFGPTGSTAL